MTFPSIFSERKGGWEDQPPFCFLWMRSLSTSLYRSSLPRQKKMYFKMNSTAKMNIVGVTRLNLPLAMLIAT